MENLDKLYQQWQELQPLSERKRHLLRQRFAIDYNFNSNHIEGNTLTYGQTELLLLFDKVIGEGKLQDFVEMKASQAGLQMISDEAAHAETPLTQNFIRSLHKVLLREDYTVHYQLPGGEASSYTIHAGAYKTRPNSVITRYGDRFEYASPEETPSMMSDLVDWYNDAEKSGEYSPVQLAALFHYRYIRIHPFEDGNGRVARLMVNYILARHGWPMLVVRSRDKQEYLKALHRTDVEVGTSPSAGASATLQQIRHFMRYFKGMVAEELKYAIDFVRETSPDAWWYDGMKIAFRSPSSPVLLAAMHADPDITIGHLAEKAGIAPSAVKKQLRNMTVKGYIARNATDGSWNVFAVTAL